MSPLPIGAREVVALARYQRRDRGHPGPVLVSGVLADQLARELRAGGDPAAVRTDGEPDEAAAFVRVLAGAATAEDERLLRVAARAIVPSVVVQTADVSVRVPYVLAEDVVGCPPGSGFPVRAIADRLAAGLRGDGAALAASLPVLRDAVERRLTLEAAVSAASAASLQPAQGPRLPVLALTQARLLSDIEAAKGKPSAEEGADAAQTLALPLGAALATGYAARTLVRSLPGRSRLLDGLVAAGGSLLLVAAFRRLPRR